MSDREEKLYSWIKFFVSFCVMAIIFITICFCCFYPFGKTENYGNYIWLSPIIKFFCYVFTILSITIICKLLIDFGIKINNNALSFEKAKMVSEKISTPEKKECEKTINLNIKKE